MFGLGRSTNAVGLDIGASSVKAVQIKRSRGANELVRLGVAPLHPETIVDGVIMDSGTVISAIQQIFTENQIKTKDVVVAVSGHSVIVKKVRITKMKPEELEEAIPFEAEQYVPYAIEDVNLDFQVLGNTDPGAPDMDVLLVAVKKDIINDYLSIISTAGLNAVVVDVDAFALENAFELSYELDRDLGLSYEQAEMLKLGGDVDGRTFQDAQPAIDMVNAEVAGEIRRSFDFFRSSSHSDTIHRVILSGGCARLPGLVEYLSENLEISFEVANPLRNIKADPKKFNPEQLEMIAPQLAVSVGLALRQAGDK
jgi:type IV pilus assembly protein PilM